jgi:protein-glucosylgalactosylhydroxylysine glucosidase
MASFAQLDSSDGKFHLCPPIIPAQERFKATETSDPIFELTYWEWGLKTALEWETRLGIERNMHWVKVVSNLAALPEDNLHYLPTRESTDFFENAEKRIDHPIVVGAYGYLPNTHIDAIKMRRTYQATINGWDWPSTWGWDYPLLAMTATRLNDPESAISALLMDTQKNTYLVNGHNYQDKRLSIYLPGNGGILSVAAMMSAGFEGCTKKNPGFPDDWDVRWEGLSPMF